MQKVALMSLVLFANSSAALAATPVFQLHESDASSRLRAIDIISPKPESDTALRNLQMPSSNTVPASASRGGAFISNVLYNPASNGAWSNRRADATIMPVGNATYADYSDNEVPRNAGGTKMTVANTGGMGRAASSSRVASADDSMFYFLKNFKARPLRKPASGTMMLVGFCFVLYQIRRRPMRSSIAFYTAAKSTGRHAA